METDSIVKQGPEHGQEIGGADLVVRILGEFGADAVAAVCDALRSVSGSPRIAILHDGPSPNLPNSNSEGSASLFFVPLPPPALEAPGVALLSVVAAYQSVFVASEKFGARGCCVIASQIEGAPLQWVCRLAEPLLGGETDFVVPYYARHKFEGLLNSSIISPLMRSLYGKRIHNPMGPDLGISRRLFSKILGAELKAGGGGVHPLASLAPTAVCTGLQVSEVHIGPRIYAPTDWTNISSLLARVLDPVFADMERNAACWQRIRGSAPVAAAGDPVFVSQDAGSVEVKRMVESFQLGNRELQEIWSLVLPPATLFELRKLLRLSPDQFHMDDALWVRIVYDFALAHRLRTINRDHLLKSMTPLYLGWAASYAREVQNAGALALGQRLERLALAYESGKPYLVSRWRWPDRFSP